MVNVLLRISYLGTSFFGSQRQKKLVTAQGEIERVLSIIYGTPIKTTPCSRLDRDVSAEDWGVSYLSDKDLSFYRLKYALNRLLSDKMHVKSISYLPLDTNARKEAKKKIYCYSISLHEADPITDVASWVPSYKFDKEKLKEGMELFKGEHDFSCFYSKDKDDEEECPYKEIEDVKCSEENGFLKIYVKGHAFGRYQVRFMVGTAYLFARGQLSRDDIVLRLQGKKKDLLRFKAPGCGLVLNDVEYRLLKEETKC